MIVPPFIGQEVIRSAGPIADEKGYVKVRDTYQAQGYDNEVFSATMKPAFAA